MRAYAGEPGSSCMDAIPLGDNYSASVKKGQSIWYSAWTFDLPLSVYFAPENGSNDPAPEVEMDFSCTSGYYEDSILCSLFCKTSGGSGIEIDMPHKPGLNNKVVDGTFVYYLSLGKQYRDLLLQMGISYNLEVYVKVTYNSNGTIAMAPDDLFSNCVDGPQFMHIGDTVHVAANDKNTHVIIPYVQWQEDTIIYKWIGTAPCTMAIAKTCDFDPENNADENIIEFEPNIQPGDSAKATATDIYKWMHNAFYQSEAGLYYAKFYSTAPGKMVIKKALQSPPRGKATLLRLDKTYALNANETALFAIPASWDTLNTKFTTPTEHVFRMTIATDPDFSEAHTLKQYEFERTPKGRWQGIRATDMVELWKKTSEQYLYVRFDCTEATTITPSLWDELKCNVPIPISIINSLDTTFKVDRNSKCYYKLNYCQYAKGDMTFAFSQKKNCKIYIATDCDIEGVSTAPNILYYNQLTTKKNTDTIPAEEIASWVERVNEEGYIFMRLHHTESVGTYRMTLKSTAPADADPVYPASTIAVLCEGSQIVVNVSKPQTITIENEGKETVDSWDAVPDTPHQVVLPSGTYLLRGEEEEIALNL